MYYLDKDYTKGSKFKVLSPVGSGTTPRIGGRSRSPIISSSVGPVVSGSSSDERSSNWGIISPVGALDGWLSVPVLIMYS